MREGEELMRPSQYEVKRRLELYRRSNAKRSLGHVARVLEARRLSRFQVHLY
jgi:hypothetical protein